ncbi:MAG: signal transduction histidine kinase [Myxococcota bacterium]|jgi:signal transduction histidine kinase
MTRPPGGPGALRSIRFRIVGAFLVAMFALLGALGFLVARYQEVSRSQALITEGYLPLATAVGGLAVFQQRVDTDLDRLLRGDRRPATGAEAAAQLYTAALAEALEEARIHARGASRLATRGEERARINKIAAQLDRIDTLFQQYEAEAARFQALVEHGERDDVLTGQLSRTRTDLGNEITTLDNLIASRIASLSTETDAMRIRATGTAGLAALAAAAISAVLLAAVLLALRPIARLTAEVQRLATGDYSGRVDVRGADEIAYLAREFNGMVEAVQQRDRTLVERAEQLNRLSRYLGSVLDTLRDGLVVIEDGVVTLANPAARSDWSVAQGSAPLPPLAHLLASPGASEVQGPDGRTFQARVTPFGDRGQIAVLADITDAVEAKERLAHSERLALVGQMLAQITHEVRNPLNALSLNAEMLADELGALDPERHTEAWDLLGTVSGEIDRLTEVTAHYLQLARRPPARLEPESPGGLVRDVARLLTAELHSRGVSLTLTIAELPRQRLDGNQLRQALLNVVRNAVDAGGLELVLTVEATDRRVRVALADDGPGMTTEQMERATDPFFSTKATGTGLGLAITRQILEDHGGAVEIQSQPGQGTTVALVLPRRDAPEDT